MVAGIFLCCVGSCMFIQSKYQQEIRGMIGLDLYDVDDKVCVIYSIKPSHSISRIYIVRESCVDLHTNGSVLFDHVLRLV
jgi:hypothetical protein